MNFNLSRGNLAFLFLAWSFYFLLGGTVALTVPFVLILIATILYLIA